MFGYLGPKTQQVSNRHCYETFAGIKTKQSGGKCHGYHENLLVLVHISLQITATSFCLKNGFLGLANLSIK